MLKLLILGAHPDDAEYHAGGLAATYRELGHAVRMVSATDGSAGHHLKSRVEMAQIRRQEATAAASVIGAEYDVWEYPDGQLLPELDLRWRVIQEIRRFAPDLVLTHRPYDYHPDHRALGQAVQDASFLVTVPHIVPEVPALRRDPVVGYLPDLFTRPIPLQADVVLDITERIDTVTRMLACHRSQCFEWLPYLAQAEELVPRDPSAEHAWLRAWYLRQIRPRADRFRQQLIATYGPEWGGRIEFAEVFEISQYARPLDDAERQRLFPFIPRPAAVGAGQDSGQAG